jgi:hypothetical protein
MKRLLLLFLLSSISAYSQILEIQITEGQTFFGDSALTMSQILDPINRQSSPKLTKHSRYVIDVSNNHLDWYIKDALVSEWPVDVVSDRGLVYIYILNPYYPGVLILNSDPFNETLVYSDKVDNDTRYIVYTKFTITKSQ